MWDRLFSEDDRQQFGDDLDGAYHKHGTPGMFSYLRGVSLPRAVADVAFGLEFLAPQKYQWLLRGMGDHGAKVRAQTSPHWNSKAGILSVDGKTVRELRITAEPSKLQQILDAFQDADWASRIENPLPNNDQQKAHQAVFRLDKDLTGICFHVQKGGHAITWSRMKP